MGVRESFGQQVTEFIESNYLMALKAVSLEAVLIHAAIDSSGSVTRDRYVSYGIVAALRPGWEKVHEQWMVLLEKHDLACIRMTDAMAFEGAFKNKFSEWGADRETRRDAVLLEFAKTIRDNLTCVGVSIDMRQLPTEKEYRYRKKLMFQAIVRRLLQVTPSKFVFAFICDDEQDAAVDYYRYLSNFKLKYQSLANRIGGICFFDDKTMAQLQAADMYAYVLRDTKERETSEPSRPPLPVSAYLLQEKVEETEEVTFLMPKGRDSA